MQISPPAGAGPDLLLHPDRPVLLALPQGEKVDLEHTLRCGQVFRWRREGDTWYGPYRRGSLAFREVPGGVEARVLGEAVTLEEARRYLDLDTSLLEARRRLSGDPWVCAAMDALPGLRIVRQDPWECVAAYICSQWNNIPKIELSTERLARAWGAVHRWPVRRDGVEAGGRAQTVEVASFPRPEALAALEPEALRPSALGYRCGYLVETARRVADGVDLEALRGASYDHALAALLQLPGVGRKVADCILLFSLDQPRACPVDVWVRRVVHELYPEELTLYLPDLAERAGKPLTGREYEAILRFAGDRWGDLAGYAQQYLFHARRLGLIGPRAG